MFVPALNGGKVSLEPFVRDHITPAYISWLNDPEVVRFSNQRFATHSEVSAATYLKSFEGSSNSFMLIRRSSDGRAVGTLTVYVNTHHGTADVGIMIGEKAAWGGGYGQAAWDAVLNWLLDQEQIRKVTAGTLACNLGMVKLMERSGMTLEGVRKAQELVDGVPEDVVLYARFAVR
ncbi:MAG: GNAT family N-acetyltransferase [Brevundimonas sp.]|jgi:RimJ/RimL family protein N-acetyltransferase|uniref:GNAT family N-acetyltransferase n=1 Tax=Brevundimonas sp. TaxID=1871086 RepID=UPI00403405BE